MFVKLPKFWNITVHYTPIITIRVLYTYYIYMVLFSLVGNTYYIGYHPNFPVNKGSDVCKLTLHHLQTSCSLRLQESREDLMH